MLQHKHKHKSMTARNVTVQTSMHVTDCCKTHAMLVIVIRQVKVVTSLVDVRHSHHRSTVIRVVPSCTPPECSGLVHKRKQDRRPY